MADTLVIGSNTATDPFITINGASAAAKTLQMQTAGIRTWDISSDSSGNYKIRRFDGTGAFIENAILFNSATGVGQFAQTPTFPTPTIGNNSTKGATTAFVLSTAEVSRIFDARNHGCACDGTTDDTVAFQALITSCLASGHYCEVRWEGIIKLTATVNITGPICLAGIGAEPRRYGTTSKGSWLFFSHTGKGLYINSATQPIVGTRLNNFGTVRTQPAPAANWVPTNHDFDIFISNADVIIPEITILNATKGIWLDSGNASGTSWGRLQIDCLRGQAFKTMVQIDEAYDVCRVNNVHIWPFWSSDTRVTDYMVSQLYAIKLGRADNPMLSNIFTLYAFVSLHFYQNTHGLTSKCKVINIDCDLGVMGIFVDSSIDGSSGLGPMYIDLVNFSAQGQLNKTSSAAVMVAGSNCIMGITNYNTRYHHTNSARLDGTGNKLVICGQVFSNETNWGGVGFAAFEAAVGNKIDFIADPLITNTNGGANYGGAGIIRKASLVAA